MDGFGGAGGGGGVVKLEAGAQMRCALVMHWMLTFYRLVCAWVRGCMQAYIM